MDRYFAGIVATALEGLLLVPAPRGPPKMRPLNDSLTVKRAFLVEFAEDRDICLDHQKVFKGIAVGMDI
jgi:hypothetical protein